MPLFTTATVSGNCVVGNCGPFLRESAEHCTSIGWCALDNDSSGSGNVAVGCQAGNAVTTGGNNTFLGYQAGISVVSGSNNINIGNGVSSDAATSNETRIGSQSTQTQALLAGVFGSSQIGTATVLANSDGYLTTNASSLRYKENIEQLSNLTDVVLSLNPVAFNYISDKTKRKEFGLIAEEVEKVFPDIVLYKEGKVESVQYHHLPILLLAAIRDLAKRLQSLEEKVANAIK